MSAIEIVVIVAVVVFLVAVIGTAIYKKVTGKSSGCDDCGCSGCSGCQHCNVQKKKDEEKK